MVELVRPVGRLDLVLRAARQTVTDPDPLDHENLLFDQDVTFGVGCQPAAAGVDSARLQRAPEGAAESTGGGGHDIVERGRVVGKDTGRRAVVLPYFVVGAEENWFGLGRQVGAADRPPVPLDPHLGDVHRLVHAAILTGSGIQARI